jgi:succinate-acetate transporter protein
VTTEVEKTPPTADPGPLGLAGFAMTTMVLSCFNANFLDARLTAVVLPLALFYGGIAQLLAGMWEFRKGNTFGATAFSSFGAFWLAFWLFASRIAPGLPPRLAHQGEGLFLLGWFIFTGYMTVAARAVSIPMLALFTSLTITFGLLMLGAFNQTTWLTRTGGWFGLLTALIAWGISFLGVQAATTGARAATRG